MDTLQSLSREDEAARERLNSASEDMVQRTCSWSDINTGSWNTAGLKSFAPVLAGAFSELQAHIDVIETEGFEAVADSGMTGPVIEVTARPEADVQVIMSGHYDTVFPEGTFEGVTDLGDGRLNGPGMADMKGGLCVMLEALKAFEAGSLRDRLGYKIVLTRAAKSGAMIGMTYEPAMETGAMSGGRKGSAVFDIVLHGKAAHAGRAKEEGRSAIEAAAELVLGLEAMNGTRDGVTLNVGSIDGGSAVNIVPDLAVVRFGARAPDAESAECDRARWHQRSSSRGLLPSSKTQKCRAAGSVRCGTCDWAGNRPRTGICRYGGRVRGQQYLCCWRPKCRYSRSSRWSHSFQ